MSIVRDKKDEQIIKGIGENEFAHKEKENFNSDSKAHKGEQNDSQQQESSDDEESVTENSSFPNDFLFKNNDVYYYADDDRKNFCAYIGESLVGEMTLDEDTEADLFWLEYIDVNPGHQKKGIGSQLIALAVDCHGSEFRVPNAGHLGNRHQYYLSEAGAALVNSCIRKKIIDEKTHCKVPPLNKDCKDNGDSFCAVEDEEQSYEFLGDEFLCEEKKEDVANSSSPTRTQKKREHTTQKPVSLFFTGKMISKQRYKDLTGLDIPVSNNFGKVV